MVVGSDRVYSYASNVNTPKKAKTKENDLIRKRDLVDSNLSFGKDNLKSGNMAKRQQVKVEQSIDSRISIQKLRM